MKVYEQLDHPLALGIFVLTLFGPVIIGLVTSRMTLNQSDFFVGGRRMNRFVVALSAVSSGRSSWLVLGLSGMAYTMGAGAVWAVVGYITVEFFQFIYLGPKLRRYSEKYGSITLLDYFESRFNDTKHVIRITGAVIITFFLTAYVAAQFNAGAKALGTALDLPLIPALVLTALLIIIYMAMGGFIAVAYNDVVRAVIMMAGLLILPATCLFKMGGFGVLTETLRSLNPAYVDPFSLGAGVITGFIGIGLGSPGQPHIVVRYMSIKDPEELKYSGVFGTVWNILMAWGALFTGLAGRALFPEISSLPDKNPEMIYLVLSSRYFGPVLYGLLVGGIFAAILSTADSQLLVVSSTFVRDVYGRIMGRSNNAGKGGELGLSRIIVVVSGIAAMVLAYAAKDLIFWLVLFAWAGLGASFGTCLIFSLFWKRTHKYAVVSGMITGTLVTIIWKLFLKEPTGIYELIPAFAFSSIVIVLVSLRQKRCKTE